MNSSGRELKRFGSHSRAPLTSKMSHSSKRGNYTSPEGSSTWEYISAACCALGTVCMGTMIGWNSPSLAEYMAPGSPILMTPDDASTLSASMSLGSMTAPLFSFFITDRIGKKNTLVLTAIPMMINWGMIMIANSVIVLIMARLLAGIAMGIQMITIPMYMGEVLSAYRRASSLGITLIAFQIGILFMFAVAPHLGIRMTAGVGFCIALIFMVCFWFAPDSPYHLVMVGRVEDAERALEKLRGKTDVVEEIELIKATNREKGKALMKSDKTAESEVTDKKQSAFVQLFRIRGNLKALSLGIVLTTVQHYCGFTTIATYCSLILTAMATPLDVYAASLTFSILQVLSAGLCIFIGDKFGRKTLILFSGVMSSLLLMIIAVYFYLMDFTDVDAKIYAIVPLGSFFILVVVFNVGILPIPAVVLGEIFAADVKVLGNAIVWMAGSSLTVLCTKSHLLMATSWGLGHGAPFLIYSISTFVCTVILIIFLPETRGKTLLEIQQKLNA